MNQEAQLEEMITFGVFVESAGAADSKVCFVNSRGVADLLICYVSSRGVAGWQNEHRLKGKIG
ncbi:MAG: DUF6150 family protein [Cyclobacteriaceae bacterium]